jgi:hypothetical protein
MATIWHRFYPKMSLGEIKRINPFANNDWLNNGENLTPKRRNDIIRLINNQDEVTSEQIKQKGRNEGRYAAFRAIVHGFAIASGHEGLIVNLNVSKNEFKEHSNQEKVYVNDKISKFYKDDRDSILIDSYQMINLRKAIANGLWLKTEFAADNDLEIKISEKIAFQLKILSFTKIDIIKEVDTPFNLEEVDLDANLWLLKIEFINLCRKTMSSSVLVCRLILVDEEGFQFPTVKDHHLYLMSDYAKTSGLYRFYATDLPPKIKRKGALAFELPEKIDELYVGVKNGSVLKS